MSTSSRSTEHLSALRSLVTAVVAVLATASTGFGAGPFLTLADTGTASSRLRADLSAQALTAQSFVVTRTTLGTINHTLLTIEALRARWLSIAGVVMVGDPNPDNREAIERFGRVTVIGELPVLSPLTPAALQEAALGLSVARLADVHG